MSPESRARLILVSMLLMSAALHAPEAGLYSDIVHLYKRIYIEGRGWYDGPRWYGLPYIDYKFEYPPLVGVLWSISTLPRAFVGEPWGLYMHYTIQAALIILLSHTLPVDLRRLSGRGSKPLYIAVLTPSVFTYGVYNWDLVASAFTVRGVRYAVEGRPFMAGFMVGLASSTKVFPLAAVIPLLMDFRRSSRSIIAGLAAGTVPLLLFMLTGVKGFHDFIAHHAGWYIEGSWLLLVASGPGDRLVITLSKAMMILLPLLASLYTRGMGVVERVWVSISVALLSSYVYTPQMNLLIAPLGYILGGGYLLLIQDVAASLVIYTWFYSEDPLSRFSIPSILSYVKCILLALLVARLILSSRRGRGA